MQTLPCSQIIIDVNRFFPDIFLPLKSCADIFYHQYRVERYFHPMGKYLVIAMHGINLSTLLYTLTQYFKCNEYLKYIYSLDMMTNVIYKYYYYMYYSTRLPKVIIISLICISNNIKDLNYVFNYHVILYKKY